MHQTAPWYRLNQTIKRALSESRTDCYELWYRVCHKAILSETAFITLGLTFLYISFPILFCQKKSRKSVSTSCGFSLKSPSWDVRKATGSLRLPWEEDFLFAAMLFYYYTRKSPSLFVPYCVVWMFLVLPWWFMNKKPSLRNFYRTNYNMYGTMHTTISAWPRVFILRKRCCRGSIAVPFVLSEKRQRDAPFKSA